MKGLASRVAPRLLKGARAAVMAAPAGRGAMLQSGLSSMLERGMRRAALERPARRRRRRRVGGGSGSVAVPAAMGSRGRVGVPKISGSGRSIVVSHEEFFQNVNGSTGFRVNGADPANPTTPSGMKIAIQPNSGNWPWLEAIAMEFEAYEWLGVEFTYRPTCATTTTGSVMMAIDYDWGDPVPVSKAEMLAMDGYHRASSWVEFSCSPERGRLREFHKQIRYTAAAPNNDAYDVALGRQQTFGYLVLGTDGQADTSQVGELFIRYTVRFTVPQPDVIKPGLSITVTSGGTITKTAVLGDAATTAGDLALTASGDTLTFNRRGEYLVSYRFVGTGMELDADYLDAASTATYTNHSLDYNLAAAATVGRGEASVRVVERGQTFVFDLAGVTTVTAGVVRVSYKAYSAA